MKNIIIITAVYGGLLADSLYSNVEFSIVNLAPHTFPIRQRSRVVRNFAVSFFSFLKGAFSNNLIFPCVRAFRKSRF